ncbi:DUF3429 domain-containing protein [Lysobacter xanthus]
MDTPAAPTRSAWLLGLTGLVPFVAGTGATWLLPTPQGPHAAFALAAYGATIVAFLGGLHWGLAARSGQSALQYAWGAVPSLVAWGALLLPTRSALAVLASALVACYAVDRRVLPAQGLAGWRPLRLVLTVVAAGSCLVAASALR